MGELLCVDGSVLSVAAVAIRDRVGHAYEITLELARDSAPFAAVGERCGYRLAQLADRVRAARQDPEQAALWPDPDDRFPAPARLHDYLPGDCEYFSLRSRDRGDPAGRGELRCTLRSSADWIAECAGIGGSAAPCPGDRDSLSAISCGEPVTIMNSGACGASGASGAPGAGGWRLTRRAVVEAWGGDGIGIRAVLTSAELVTFLDTVLRGPGDFGLVRSAPVGETTVSEDRREGASLVKRQRGKVPDGSTRSRLPALRAQARGVAVAERDSAARRGDVRR